MRISRRTQRRNERKAAPRRPDPNDAGEASRLDALKVLTNIMHSEAFAPTARVSAALGILRLGPGRPGPASKRDADAPIEQVIRWAETAAEAMPDPSAT